MTRFLTIGNLLFCIGAVFECAALEAGVHSTVVAWSMVVYGVLMVMRGYLP